MQDQSSIYSQIKPQFPDQEILKCPRCDSINTKFCYYNNYNLSQPRHFCKNCKRYWTKGGILRNIPVGGSSRKNTKRSSSTNSKRSSSSSTSTSAAHPKTEVFATPVVPVFDQNSPILDVNGPFSSLLLSNGPEMGNLLETLNTNGPNPGFVSGSDAASQSGNFQNSEDSNCWNGSNSWPDLAIYTPVYIQRCRR